MMVAPLGAVSAESWVLFLIPSLDVPLGQLKGPAALASTPILFGFSNALSLAVAVALACRFWGGLALKGLPCCSRSLAVCSRNSLGVCVGDSD
jgi:hypothetical protein